MLNLPSYKDSRSVIDEETQSVKNWGEYLETSKDEFFGRYRASTGPRRTAKLGDFELMRTVGTGWYGRVILVRDRSKGRVHALKVFRKEVVVKLDQVRHIFNEKKIIQACDFPFITPLEYYFTDNSNIYFVMPFIVGGELFSLLKRMGKLDEYMTKFYSAQVILVLEYLHNMGVVYRDIKPENILIDKDGYIKVTDFGFAKMLDGRTYTMCGTPEYFAPEMITNAGYGTSVDWWSLGVLIYEMSCGHSPFARRTPERPSGENGVFRHILSGVYALPHFFSEDLKDVVVSLLQMEVWKRTQGQRLRRFPWYRQINWLSLINKRLPAPYLPTHVSDYDSSNYDVYDEPPLITSSQDDFGDLFVNF